MIISKRKQFSDNALVGTEKFQLDTVIEQWEQLLFELQEK